MSNTDVTKNGSASWSIGVIIYIFIVMIAAAIYILFYKEYSEKHEQDEILNSNYVETVTTDITTTIFTSPEETTTSSVTTYTTVSSTTHSEVTTSTASEITTETQTTISVVPYEMYESASLRALEDFMFDNSFNDSVMYGLCDVNADGVPELLINYATEADDMTSMYIFFETDYRQAVSFGGSAEICAAQHLIQSFGYGGASVRKIFEMDARGNISSKDELYEEYIGVDTMYYALNGIEIGKAQYDELNEYYDSLKWEYVCNTEYKRSAIETPSDSM